LRRIPEPYWIEDGIRGPSADELAALRQERSQPIVTQLERCLREKVGLMSQKTKLVG
jgi:hypothetical protein